MNINASGKKTVLGTTGKYIHIDIEDQVDDYYPLVVAILQRMVNHLYGGHYEPASRRDFELAKDIEFLLEKHKCY